MKNKLVIVLMLTMLGFVFSSAASAAEEKKPFSRFIRPLSNPVYSIDPRNETTIRVIHARQKLPEHIKTTIGDDVKLDGDLNVTALQLTYAINERLSIVAEKTGYIDFNPDNTLSSEDGWADYGAGLKYAFIYNPEDEFIVSGRLMLELTQGSNEVFQGNGEGNIAAQVNFLKGFCKFQVNGGIGAIIPFDREEESTIAFSNLHVSYALTPKIFPLIELNHFAVVREGRSGTVASQDELVASIVEFEGGDLINLGADHGNKNKHIVTLAAGIRFRCMENLDIGVAYEIPLTDKNANLMRDRITFDLVFYF